MRTLVVVPFFLAVNVAALAAPPARLDLSLAQAEARALAQSDQVLAAEYLQRAANARALAVSAQLAPRLALEGSYRYLSEVAELTLPGGTTRALGDHANYSIGPTLTYLLYDAGGTGKSVTSAERAVAARAAERRATETEVRLALRSAYFAVQHAIERMRLVIDSLRLAQARHADIGRRIAAGAASRADLLSAHTDVLDFELKLRQAQADLAAALADLLALTGSEAGYDLTRPVAAAFPQDALAGLSSPTLVVQLDPLQPTLTALAQSLAGRTGPHSARLTALDALAESSRLAAESHEAARWPKLQLYARSSLDYPNGPVLDQFNQNTVGLNLALPLFEGGRTRALADESRAQAQSLEHQRRQLQRDLDRDWDKVMARLDSLERQRAVAHEGAAEAEKIAELMFLSYKAGRTRYLEVQSANLRALEWNVNRALVETQLLIQLAVQASLSEGAP